MNHLIILQEGGGASLRKSIITLDCRIPKCAYSTSRGPFVVVCGKRTGIHRTGSWVASGLYLERLSSLTIQVPTIGWSNLI